MQKVSLGDWSNQALSNEQLAAVKGGFGFPHNIFATRKRLTTRNPFGGTSQGAGGTYLVDGSSEEGEFEFEEEIG